MCAHHKQPCKYYRIGRNRNKYWYYQQGPTTITRHSKKTHVQKQRAAIAWHCNWSKRFHSAIEQTFSMTIHLEFACPNGLRNWRNMCRPQLPGYWMRLEALKTRVHYPSGHLQLESPVVAINPQLVDRPSNGLITHPWDSCQPWVPGRMCLSLAIMVCFPSASPDELFAVVQRQCFASDWYIGNSTSWL